MHAYLIISDNSDINVEQYIPQITKPFYVHKFSKIKIDDIRTINTLLISGGNESHVIYFDSFLDVAQNAFLKTLEEPANGKNIILITKSQATLLDTLLSRLHIVQLADTKFVKKEKFIELATPSRLELVKKILDGEHDTVRTNAQQLISNILQTPNLPPNKKQILAKMYDDLFASGSSPKQILEFLAVTL